MAAESVPAEPAPSEVLSLLVESPAGDWSRVSVTRNPFLIGRLQECDLPLRDSRISRRHARIVREEGSYAVEDLRSRHGVTVNGDPVRRRALAVGDVIGFGIEDSFVLTVCENISPNAPLLRRVAKLAAPRNRTGALGRLSAVLDVARTMEASEGVDEVFEAVVEAALTIAGADRAFLLLRNPSGSLEVKIARAASGLASRPAELAVPLSVVAQAMDRRRDLFDMTIEPESGGDAEVARELRQALCVPILRMRIGQHYETTVFSARKDTLGVLYMDTREADIRLAEGNRALLQALAIEISTVLENARLIEEEREKRRLEQELRIARDIQRALLPAALPEAGWLVAKGHCEPSAHLGGDYFDVMQVAPGTWGAVVADVAGKGVAASLLASLLQGAFFLGAGPQASLSDILGRINRYICERSGVTRFATVFALLLDEDGSMRWSNAGHCPALLVRADGAVEWLPPNSKPVGALADAEFAEGSCRLQAGDKLALYSDGVSEARNAAGEMFGERRLGEVAARCAALGAADFLDGLLGSVRAFRGEAPRRDDLTILALGYRPDPSRSAPGA